MQPTRRELLAMLGGIVLGAAVPFGRVYSFPSVIRPLNLMEVLPTLPDDWVRVMLHICTPC